MGYAPISYANLRATSTRELIGRFDHCANEHAWTGGEILSEISRRAQDRATCVMVLCTIAITCMTAALLLLALLQRPG